MTDELAMGMVHGSVHDMNIFGIGVDHKVGLEPDVLADVDGPTLRDMLQEVSRSKIQFPTPTCCPPSPRAGGDTRRLFLLSSYS